MKKISLLITLSLTLILSGCTKNPVSQTNKPSSQNAEVTDTTFFIYAEGSIQQIRQSDGLVVSSYLLPEEYTPISFSLKDTFKTSFDGKYVVWFVPGKGIARFNTQKQAVDIFYEPTEWFHENPYFTFYGKTNTIILIDKKGSENVWIDLDTNTKTSRSVPYPFGTLFVISPDLKRIAYVEGFGQTVGRPTYLITTDTGEPVTQLKTNSEISDRSLISWMPDSQSLIVVESKNKVVRYRLEQAAQPDTFISLPEGDTIITFEVNGNYLLIGTETAWSLYDLSTAKLTRRMPIEALHQLTKPKIVSFNSDSFLIEEDVRSFEQTFKRLWKGTWTGDRNIIVPSYGRRIVEKTNL